MIIVTGGAGFIGSNLVAGLNRAGMDRILVVDNLHNAQKVENLADLRFADYLDKDEFRRRLHDRNSFGTVEAVFHQGACSDTMESDGRYMMENNFQYSKDVYEYCQRNALRMIYASSASVYGSGPQFREDPDCERPLNAYALSKWLFDCYVRARPSVTQVVGLRYFNVYGDREQHKQRMASVAYHFFHQYREHGRVRLFEGTHGYAHGEQRRDFVWIDDVVDVNLYFLQHPERQGIFNVGTGRAGTFNDVAQAVIAHAEKHDHRAAQDVADLVAAGKIEYVGLPENLQGKYQSFTEADLEALRAAGYRKPFATVAEGVRRYAEQLHERTAPIDG